MGRADNSTVKMHDLYEKNDGKPPQLQNRQTDACGHDNEHVAGVDGIVFYSFQDNKIVRFFLEFFIIAVGLVGVMVCNEHTLIAFLL